MTLLPKNAGYDFPMIPLENSFVVVMGMHRSGTSALSRTLNLAGARYASKPDPAKCLQ